jgi:hypothetical protein
MLSGHYRPSRDAALRARFSGASAEGLSGTALPRLPSPAYCRLRCHNGHEPKSFDMFETPVEMAQLQRLLDESYARAGEHLLAIHAAPARITADQLVAELQGMHVFVVATTTSECEPRTGPVDCFLYRGEVRFGTSANAHRARHLARSGAVSATHVRGEGLVVTVHGGVKPIDLEEADRDFGEYLRDHYGGAHYERYLVGSPYYRIVPHRMYAADMTVH